MMNISALNTPLFYVAALCLAIGFLVGLFPAIVRKRRTINLTGVELFEFRMEQWSRYISAMEHTLLDNITAITPWIGPAIPAAISYHNLTTYLDFPFWLAFLCALVVEFLGLAAVHTVFELWQYNQTKREKDEKAPMLMALGTAGAYMLVVVTINFILEATYLGLSEGTVRAAIASKFLLSLLSAVSAVVLAVRSQHRHRTSLIEEDKTKRQDAHELGRLRKRVPELEELLSEVKTQLKDANKQVAHESKVIAKRDEELEAAFAQNDQLIARLDQATKQIADLQKMVQSLSAGSSPAVDTSASNSKEENLQAMLSFVAANPDASFQVIADHLGVAKSTVSSYKEELEQRGRLVRNGSWHVTRS